MFILRLRVVGQLSAAMRRAPHWTARCLAMPAMLCAKRSTSYPMVVAAACICGYIGSGGHGANKRQCKVSARVSGLQHARRPHYCFEGRGDV